MANVYEFTKRDPRNQFMNVGKMVLDKSEDGSATLNFYGDICGAQWQSEWFPEGKAPQDIVDFLGELDGTERLDVHINSGGGDVFGGIAIYNILKRYRGDKICYIDGIAASIASVIMFACDKIICPSCAQIMIHKPWSACVGDADDMLKCAESLDSCQKAITSIYAERAKVDEGKITELINAETWLTGENAAEIFDIEVDKTAAPVACAKSEYFDKYKNAPKNITEPPKDGENTDKERLQIELDLLKM